MVLKIEIEELFLQNEINWVSPLERLNPVQSLALLHFLVCTPTCRRAWNGKEEHNLKCKLTAYYFLQSFQKNLKENLNFIAAKAAQPRSVAGDPFSLHSTRRRAWKGKGEHDLKCKLRVYYFL